MMSSSTKNNVKVKMGPAPTLLSRKQVDALYETLEAVINALKELKVDYIVTGGSLLGAIRQHSILFCDDDIDMAILDYNGCTYETIVKPKLQQTLGSEFIFQIEPWEGGDRIRPRRMTNVFLDLFVLRKYQDKQDMIQVIGKKKNGQEQSYSYVQRTLDKMETSAFSQGENTPLWPCWQFSTRKAIEMWTKEVYRECELFPLTTDLKMGPVTQICGPNKPVLLLKRAFGNDCFDVYFQSACHGSTTSNSHQHQNRTENKDLQPIVMAGGTWEGGKKTSLQEEMYLPMQPIAKSKRRPTLHCKDALMEYLAEQTLREQSEVNGSSKIRQHRTVYMDGVFDLFHIGHLEAIRQCALLGDRVIIGVTGDLDATDYKRSPIVPESERTAIVHALREVDKVVCPCPLVVTKEFMACEGIDLVVHGFANDADAERQREFFDIPMKMGKFQRIPYYEGLSTTDRIRTIQTRQGQDDISNNEKSNWFGYTLATATNHAPTIRTDPFPMNLRQVIEPHIEKARKRRQDSLSIVQQATGGNNYDSIMETFRQHLAQETDMEMLDDAAELKTLLLQSMKLPSTFDLSQIHSFPGKKDEALHSLTMNYQEFQQVYERFVLEKCIPLLAAKLPSCDKWYYQAFPCIRMIQPREFSIGPHADVSYGHHPCTLNVYIPLTKIGGASSLFLESRPGAEDWHPIAGDIGLIKQFAGAQNLHWTTENYTESTRVSLDFRLIAGDFYGKILGKGGKMDDVYRKKPGYYNYCVVTNDGTWQRQEPMVRPDARNGFPWTVKDWAKFWDAQK